VFGASLESGLLLVRQYRLENFDDSIPPNDARQGKRDAVAGIVAPDRDDGTLVAHNDLGYARGDHPNAILARVVALDDCNIGVAYVFLQAASVCVEQETTAADCLLDRHAADARGGPQKYLRRPVLADDLRVDSFRADAKALREMHAKPQ